MRELELEMWGVKYVFREDMTYFRSNDGCRLPWKLEDGKLMYRTGVQSMWNLFFHGTAGGSLPASEADGIFSEKVNAWIEELKFYDAVDRVLE